MPREFSRTRRVEEQMRRDLSDMIRHEIKEPGLGMISISEIRVTPDLGQAQVYVSILQDDREIIERSLETLQAYAGKLRGLLGKRMRIRRVPELTFIYDDLIRRSAELDQVIENAVEEDHRKADRYHTSINDNGEDHG